MVGAQGNPLSASYMLDTNMVSALAKGQSPTARAQLEALGDHENVCISSITEAELRYGLAKRPSAHALRAAVEGLLFKLRILPWDREEALAYGALRSRLESAGTVLGAMDMLIAAHAIAVGAVLVTNDKAFRFVEELGSVERWATE